MTSAAQINRYLKGTPLAGTGSVFVSAGRRNEVDPLLLVAISGAESSFGKAVPAGSYNPFGWGPNHQFSSWSDAIDSVAHGLHAGYISQGLTSIPQIGAKWAPAGAANDPTNLNSNWVRNVTKFYNRFGGRSPATPQTAAVAGGSPAATSPAAPLPQGPNLDQFALNNLAHISAGDYNPIKALEGLAAQTSLEGHVSPSTVLGGAGDTFSSPQPLKGPWKRYVTLAPTADRAGVHTSSSVLQFVGSLGRRVGRRLTIGTGTNHNEFVVGTQRESAHWTGHAADVPASGSQLTRLGQQALIQAGMSPREARKQKGGLFNIGGYQIIFNSDIGGNHYNHLHVGLR